MGTTSGILVGRRVSQNAVFRARDSSTGWAAKRSVARERYAAVYVAPEEDFERSQVPQDGPWLVVEGRHGDGIMFVRTNAGYRAYKGVPSYEYQVGIAVLLLNAESTGLPGPAKSASLAEIEEIICKSLEEQAESLFVAVITTSGMREFVFYTRDPSRVKQRVAALRQEITSHEIQLMIQPDKTWEIYTRLGQAKSLPEVSFSAIMRDPTL